MRRSDFLFHSVQMMCCKCYKVNFNHSPDWIKRKKATKNQKNTDDKCYQYAATVALNYEEIKWNTESFKY